MAKTMAEWKIGDPMINERDYWQDPNYVAPDPEKEKLVLQLATLITDRMVKKITKKLNNRDPEYWMLDAILNKEQVKFLLNFKKTRVPYSVEELAKMNNMSMEDTQKMVERLRWIGIIEQNRAKTPDKHLQYELPIFVPGSAEFMMMQGELTDKFPQLATFFNLMCWRHHVETVVPNQSAAVCGYPEETVRIGKQPADVVTIVLKKVRANAK